MLRRCVYVTLLLVFFECRGMRSSLISILDSNGQLVTPTEPMVCDSSKDVQLVCYGTHGNMVNSIIQRVDTEGIDKLRTMYGKLQNQYHRCHAEVFLLKRISGTFTRLAGYIIVIQQPYFPCTTNFLGTYNNGTKDVTEYNPGKTCDEWVKNFVREKGCTVIFQKPVHNSSKDSERIYAPQ